MAICHRLFYALQPPVPEQRKIASHRDRFGDLENPVASARLHLTVAITGDYAGYPDAVAARLCEIGAAAAAEPVEITLDRLSGSARSIALRSGRNTRELRALHAMLASPMARAGLLRPNWTFSPHVTLGYRQGEPFGRRIDPIHWQGQDFVLIHSVVGEMCHNEVARWPLVVRQGRLF